MNKRLSVFFVVLLILTLLLTACGSKMNDGSGRGSVNESISSVKTETDEEQKQFSDRLTIVRLSYAVRVSDVTQAVTELENALQNCGGYTENSHYNNDDPDDSAYASYTVRIPVEKQEAFEQALATVGTICRHSHSEEDVTDQYHDLTAQLKAAEAQRDRLNELVRQAKSLDDLLQLENELTKRQAEIDSLSGQIKRYDNQVAYLSAEVTLETKNSLVHTDGGAFGTAFQESFATAWEIIKGIGIGLVWLLPYLLIVGVVVLIILLCTRKSRKARKKNRFNPQDNWPLPPQPPQSSQN